MMSALHIFFFFTDFSRFAILLQLCNCCHYFSYFCFELLLHLKMALHGMHMPIIIAAAVASLLKWTA